MRRTLLVGLIALVIANAATAIFARTPPRRAAPDEAYALVYVGARDCPPCRTWDKERRSDLMAGGTMRRVAFREFVVERLAELRSPQAWPADLAGLRPYFEPLGAPQWLLLKNETVLAKAAGMTQWDEQMLPLLHYVAGR
ncbi:hypothetical protein [Prosthecomicrobium sp. N25]|uniref:hypothetical protein n=1 Tax=Prosthecomicrobium sp. N25 TaxID=3129254 RepID=UPI00307734D3